MAKSNKDDEKKENANKDGHREPDVKKVDRESYEHLTDESTSLEWDATHEARKDVMEQERERRRDLDLEKNKHKP